MLPHFCPPTFSCVWTWSSKMGHFRPPLYLWHFEIRIPAPPRKKDRFWHRLPPLSRGPRQLTFPNVTNDVGQKQKSPCFFRRRRRPKPGDAFTRTRLMPTFGVSAAPAMFSRKAGWRSKGGCLGVWGVWGCLGERRGCLGRGEGREGVFGWRGEGEGLRREVFGERCLGRCLGGV